MGDSSSNTFRMFSTDWSQPSPDDAYRDMIRISNLIFEQASSTYERIPIETREEPIPVIDYFSLPFIRNNPFENEAQRRLEKMLINSLYGGSGTGYLSAFKNILKKNKRKPLFIMVEE